MIAFLFFCLVSYFCLLFLMQRSVLYPRPRVSSQPMLAAHVEAIKIGQDHVEAWLLLPDVSSEPTLGHSTVPALIFTHGNGELIDFWREPFETARHWGVAVLLVEYPGYGRSGGRPSQASILATQLAAYDFLAQDPRIDASRIVAYGRSLGGGAACALAEQRQLAGLILESSFTSVKALARRFGLPGFLVLDPFDNLRALENFTGPVLVIHGARDRIIPVEHGEQLARTARTEAQILPCGHNDCPRPWDLVYDFLSEHGILN